MAEVKREYYSTGELETEWFEVNGKKEGESKSYYSTGKLMLVSNYVNDKIAGEFKLYYENGQFQVYSAFNQILQCKKLNLVFDITFF